MKPILCDSYAPAVKGAGFPDCTQLTDHSHSGLPFWSRTVVS